MEPFAFCINYYSTQENNTLLEACLIETKCIINQKVYDVIIDSGNIENFIPSLVKALYLTTTKDHNPYKIWWIRKGTKTQVQ